MKKRKKKPAPVEGKDEEVKETKQKKKQKTENAKKGEKAKCSKSKPKAYDQEIDPVLLPQVIDVMKKFHGQPPYNKAEQTLHTQLLAFF